MARIELPPGVTALKVGINWVEKWKDENCLLLLPQLELEFEKPGAFPPSPPPGDDVEKPNLKDIVISFSNPNLLRYG